MKTLPLPLSLLLNPEPASESITSSSPKPANGLITPPAIPPKKGDTNEKALNQAIPTRVDQAFHRFSLQATIGPKRKMLSVLFSQDDDYDAGGILVKQYVEFVSWESGSPNN